MPNDDLTDVRRREAAAEKILLHFDAIAHILRDGNIRNVPLNKIIAEGIEETVAFLRTTRFCIRKRQERQKEHRRKECRPSAS